MSLTITCTSLDSCGDGLNEMVHELALVNSKCSINGSNFCWCCLWKHTVWILTFPFVIIVLPNTTEASGVSWHLGSHWGRGREDCWWMQVPHKAIATSIASFTVQSRDKHYQQWSFKIPSSKWWDQSWRKGIWSSTSFLKVTIFALFLGSLQDLINMIFSL